MCIYIATCEDELRFHKENEHESLGGEPDCTICCHKAMTQGGDLMVHRKKAHHTPTECEAS